MLGSRAISISYISKFTLVIALIYLITGSIYATSTGVSSPTHNPITLSPSTTPSLSPTSQPTSPTTQYPTTQTPSTSPTLSTGAPTASPTLNYCTGEGYQDILRYDPSMIVYMVCNFADLYKAAKIPEDFFNLTALQYFEIRGSGATGTLSSNIKKLTNLRFFKVSDTNLEGTIPTEIGLLNRLTSLEVISNPSLIGTIPSNIGNIYSLTNLEISSNSLISGTIPPEIAQLPNLVNLIISKQPNVNGTIPEFSGTNYITINLSQNNLHGTVPLSIADAFAPYASQNPRTLDLHSNQLTGTFELFNKRMGVENILLNKNKFSGTLTNPDVNSFIPLKKLDISDNKFNGTLPDFWYPIRITNLESLRLSRNEFTTLPDGFFTTSLPLLSAFLAENPWKCNCKTIERLRTLASTRENLYDRPGIKCGPGTGYEGVIIPDLQYNSRAPCYPPFGIKSEIENDTSAKLSWEYDNSPYFSWSPPDIQFEIRCDYSIYVGQTLTTFSFTEVVPWDKVQTGSFEHKIAQLKPNANFKCRVVPFYVWYPDLLNPYEDSFVNLVKNIEAAKAKATSQDQIDSNVVVYGIGSDLLEFDTPEAAPESAPLNLRLLATERRGFTVAWGVPLIPNINPTKMQYEVNVKVKTKSGIFQLFKTIIVNDLSVSITGNVSPSTTYQITVKSKNSKGIYPTPSDSLEVKTDDPCSRGEYEDAGNCVPCDYGFYNENIDDICKPCPADFPTTFGTKSTSLSDCITQAGYFVDQTGQALSCPKQAECNGKGVSIETLPIKPGYWRSSNDSLVIYDCIHNDYCIGSLQSGRRLESESEFIGNRKLDGFDANQYCREGHEGVMCESCKGDLRIVISDKGCTNCTAADIQKEKVTLGLIIFFVPFLIIGVGISLSLLAAYLEHKNDSRRESIHVHKKRPNPVNLLWKGISVLIPTLQLIGILFAQFPTAFPDSVSQSARILSVISLNLSFSIRFPCLISFISPQHMNILYNTCGPVIVLGLLSFTRIVFGKIAEWRKKNADYLNEEFLKLWVKIFHFVYTSVSASLLREFHCTDFGNGLVAVTSEVTTLCTTPAYENWKIYTSIVSILFIPGVPFFFWYRLYKLRDFIKEEYDYNHEIEINGFSTKQLKTPLLAKIYNQTYHHFKARMYWTEPVQMMYGVFLASILPLFLHAVVKASVAEQMTVVLFTLVLLMMFLLVLKPYQYIFMNETAVASQVMLICVIFVGILFESKSITGGSDEEREIIFFVVLSMILWIGSIFIALWPIFYKYLYPKMISPLIKRCFSKKDERKPLIEEDRNKVAVLATAADDLS